MDSAPSTSPSPRILTNMAFWQSARWNERADSIYDMKGRDSDPVFWSEGSEAVRLFRRQGGYDVIVTMGARTSLLYGLLCLFAGRDAKQVMTEAFIDEARPADPLWRAKIGLYRLVAQRSLGVLASSSAEIRTISERFAMNPSRLIFVPLHSNIHDPHREPRRDGFVLSAGRTWRDYPALLAAAGEIRAPIVVICGDRDLRHAAIPPNVTVLREVPRERYLDHLCRCDAVALPLAQIGRSTGQVVMLEAMALGKPVVVTRSPGIVDYLRDGENGLLVEPGDAAGLARAVRRLLDDGALADRLTKRALEDVKRQYTFEHHAAAKMAAIERLWAGFKANPVAR